MCLMAYRCMIRSTDTASEYLVGRLNNASAQMTVYPRVAWTASEEAMDWWTLSTCNTRSGESILPPLRLVNRQDAGVVLNQPRATRSRRWKAAFLACHQSIQPHLGELVCCPSLVATVVLEIYVFMLSHSALNQRPRYAEALPQQSPLKAGRDGDVSAQPAVDGEVSVSVTVLVRGKRSLFDCHGTICCSI